MLSRISGAPSPELLIRRPLKAHFRFSTRTTTLLKDPPWAAKRSSGARSSGTFQRPPSISNKDLSRELFVRPKD